MQSEQNKTTLRILHLEDDPIDAELVERELKRHDIPCIITRICARENFEFAFREGSIDLILSDSKLPSFDTISALKWVREANSNFPFVFLSGTSSPQIKADALHAGATDFFDKNNLGRLVDFVSRLIKAKHSQNTPSHLPDIGTPVMLQCKGFRCLGYLGMDGKWHAYKDSSELPNVINWCAV